MRAAVTVHIGHLADHRSGLRTSWSPRLGNVRMDVCNHSATQMRGSRRASLGQPGTALHDFPGNQRLLGSRCDYAGLKPGPLHGGGRRFEPDAVHQSFAGKSCPLPTPRGLQIARRQPDDKQTGCGRVRLGTSRAKSGPWWPVVTGWRARPTSAFAHRNPRDRQSRVGHSVGISTRSPPGSRIATLGSFDSAV